MYYPSKPAEIKPVHVCASMQNPVVVQSSVSQGNRAECSSSPGMAEPGTGSESRDEEASGAETAFVSSSEVSRETPKSSNPAQITDLGRALWTLCWIQRHHRTQRPHPLPGTAPGPRSICPCSGELCRSQGFAYTIKTRNEAAPELIPSQSSQFVPRERLEAMEGGNQHSPFCYKNNKK